MLKKALSNLLLANSLATGTKISFWALDYLIDNLIATSQKAPSLLQRQGGATQTNQVAINKDKRQEVALSKFREQFLLASQHTLYYSTLKQQTNISVDNLESWDVIAKIPITSKEALRNQPHLFVNQTIKNYFRTMTTGSTGWPTSVHFSDYEIRLIIALSAIALLQNGNVSEQDIVQISYTTRATHINLGTGGAFARLGAMVYQTGQVPPSICLQLLSENKHLPNKKAKTSILLTYPSYLGTLIETGIELGYKPDDFELELIVMGGEMITTGLKARAETLFGSEINFLEGYALTEMLPFNGLMCSQGHLHFNDSHGLIEILHPYTYQPVQPNQVGVIVATPYMPYRETTPLIRYNTGDLVQLLPENLTCSHRHLFATSNILGKTNALIEYNGEFVFMRNIREALESVLEVPLPSRYSVCPSQHGVVIEVFVRQNNPSVKNKISEQLEKNKVPVAKLSLVTDPSKLAYPVFHRCDLIENTIVIN